MKKILFFSFLFASLAASGQTIVDRSSSPSIIARDQRAWFKLTLRAPVFADTTAANTAIGKDSLGLLIVVPSIHKVYFRDTIPGDHKWTEFALNTPGTVNWADLGGSPSDNSDLMTLFDAKQDAIATGTASQYFRGDLSLATFPTDNTAFTNGAGYLTSALGKNSITGTGITGDEFELDGDAASPGATKYYGTNGGGTKGFYTLPSPIPFDTLDIPGIHTENYFNTKYAPIGGGASAFSDLSDVDVSAIADDQMVKYSSGKLINFTPTFILQGDTATMLSSYLRKIDTTSLSSRINSKADKYIPFGTLYDKNSWSVLTDDWTIGGGATASIVSNKINISGASQSISATVGTSNSRPIQRIMLSGYGKTMLERYKLTAKIKLNIAPGSTTYGFGVGTYSMNSISAPSDLLAYLNTSTATGTGTVSVIGGGNGNYTLAVSPTTVPLNQNDYYLLTIERDIYTATATVTDLTTDTAVAQAIYHYDITQTFSQSFPNTGYFVIASYGGSFIVDSVNIISKEPYGANLMVLGDSKTAGYIAPEGYRYVSILNNYMGGGVVGRGGQSDASQDFIDALPEAMAMHPKTVVLQVGRNDLIPQYIYGPNIDTLYARLTRNGADVYLLDAIYETSKNQDSLKSYINSHYGLAGTIAQGRVIHTYQPGSITGTVWSDHIHPTALGHYIVANTIYSFLEEKNNAEFLNEASRQRTYSPVIDSLQIFGTLKVGTGKANLYLPSFWKPGDIIMQQGTGITSSNLSLPDGNRIEPVSATDGGIMLWSAQGAATNINFFNSQGGAGTKYLALKIAGNGVIATDSAVSNGFTAHAGDIYLPNNGKIGYAVSTTSGWETGIVLHNSVDNGMEFRNSLTGNFRWYTAPVTIGTVVQPLTLFKSGNLAIKPGGAPTDLANGAFQVTGNINLEEAGNGLLIKEGTNATMGTATLAAGTVTVSTTKVTTNSRIMLTVQSLGTVTAAKPVAVTARTAGTSFTITSADNTDTSIIAWIIIEPS